MKNCLKPLFTLWMLLLGWNCPAQTTGAMEGIVLDPSEAPVAASEVNLIETSTNGSRVVRTDEQGRYLVVGLPPGNYRVEASHTGFRTSVRDGIPLSAGRTVRVEFRLQLGQITEQIVVSGVAPLVSTSASDWGGVLDQQQLSYLPMNGRDVFDLAAQQPGINVTHHSEGALFNGLGIQLSVNGNRPNQNSFRIDGTYLNDAAASAPASAAGRLLGVEGIQEVRLITNPFGAEYGKAAGAVFTAVSKSGANDWHGSSYHYLRNNAFDARNFFDAPNQKTPPLRRNQFGGMLSGPVRSDRIFFLANYEGIREFRGKTQRAVTLTEEARQGILPGGQVLVSPLVKPYLRDLSAAQRAKLRRRNSGISVGSSCRQP